MKNLNLPKARLPRSSYALTALCALVLITACGKNMHVGVVTEQQKVKANALAQVKLKKQRLADATLQPMSAEEMAANKASLPYMHDEADADSIIPVGQAKLSKENKKAKFGYVKSANVVFKAIITVPAKSDGLKGFILNLQLDGARVYSEIAPVLKDEDKVSIPYLLKDQVLCLLDDLTCSGSVLGDDALAKNTTLHKKANLETAIVSNEFSATELKDAHAPKFPNSTEVLVMNKEGISVDILEKFALAGKPAADQIDWLIKHSKAIENDTSGRRTMSFAIANSLYADGGSLMLTPIKDAIAEEDEADITAPPATKAPQLTMEELDKEAKAIEADLNGRSGNGNPEAHALSGSDHRPDSDGDGVADKADKPANEKSAIKLLVPAVAPVAVPVTQTAVIK